MNLARTISIRATYVIRFKTVPTCMGAVQIENEAVYFPWGPITGTIIICSELRMVDPMREYGGICTAYAHKYFPEYTP